MRVIKLMFAFALIAAFAVFVAQNLQVVEVAFLNRSASLSLAIPLIAAYVLGGLTARAVFRFLNNRRKERKLRRQAAADAAKRAARAPAPGSAPGARGARSEPRTSA